MKTRFDTRRRAVVAVALFLVLLLSCAVAVPASSEGLLSTEAAATAREAAEDAAADSDAAGDAGATNASGSVDADASEDADDVDAPAPANVAAEADAANTADAATADAAADNAVAEANADADIAAVDADEPLLSAAASTPYVKFRVYSIDKEAWSPWYTNGTIEEFNSTGWSRIQVRVSAGSCTYVVGGNANNAGTFKWGETATGTSSSSESAYVIPANFYMAARGLKVSMTGDLTNQFKLVYRATTTGSPNTWSAWKNGGNAGSTNLDDAGMKLYKVQMALRYYVAFKANGGTGTMDTQSHHVGMSTNLTANGFTAPTGYHFAGWATSAKGAVVYTNKQSVTNIYDPSSQTRTLYAVWEENPYTVSIPKTVIWSGKPVGSVDAQTTYPVKVTGTFPGSVTVKGSASGLKNSSDGSSLAMSVGSSGGFTFTKAGSQTETLRITGNVLSSGAWKGVVAYSVSHKATA